jgi:hypothetical protein
VFPSLRLWAAHAIGLPTPWGAGAQGGLGMVAYLLRRLGDLQDALPEQGEAGPAVALALWERIYGERCDSGGCPASAARRRRVMRRPTVRAEWV